MTDGGAAAHPGREDPPFRQRSAYVGHEVFGHGDGAVLVDPEVARDLREVAESASRERQMAAGLLYGRFLTDDDGRYLVVDGFLVAGPGADTADGTAVDRLDSLTLPDEKLRALREDSARRYPAALEAGWWRSLPGPGQFGTRDYATQHTLVRPGGVGLLVFGSGLDWGSAYLGPEGRAPGSVRSFIPVPRPMPETPIGPIGPAGDLAASLVPAIAPVPVAATMPSTTALPAVLQPAPALTPLGDGPAPAATAKDWFPKPDAPTWVGPRTPTDVKVVIGALILTAIVAAAIIGALVSSAFIAVIVGVLCLLAIFVFLWMSRL